MALRETLNRIHSNPDPSNEVNLLAQVILPILGDLGWDTADPNEVLYQFIKDKISKKQRIRIAFQKGNGIGVLTNGLEWRLYLLPATGTSQDQVFATIRIKKDPIEKVTYNLETFLSKQNIINGQSKKKAIGILEFKRQAALLANELPNIWQSMLSRPDHKLVELIVERTYERLEFYPPKTPVVKILKSTFLKLENIESDNPRAEPTLPPQIPQPSEPYMKPTGIRLLGVYYNERHWKDVLTRVAEVLYERHTNTFDQILTLHPGPHRPYASRDRKVLRQPRLIRSSKIYLETNLSSESIRERSNLFLKHFGYDPPEDYLQILYD